MKFSTTPSFNWNFTLLILAFPFFLLMGCQNSSSVKALDETKLVEEHDHESGESIKLINGEKWKVDDHMMVHFRNMERAVKALKEPSLLDCQKLSTQLQHHLELLTSNCTMHGEAHDELHKWLLPYIELCNSFSEATDEEDAISYFRDIEKSFIQFNIYFQ
ncbi:MAG: hypothetical protein IPK10_06435 [Bacteroidetes bacterium]|nr:hypothetical protein [Bacteroidota bacterium]